MLQTSRPFVLIAAVLLVSLCAFAQDAHLTASPARALYQHSSWAHGYIHGYEDGFHAGNLSLHMSRPVADVKSVKGFRDAGHAYHSGFGNKSEFEHGFRSGFEVGYIDGATGKDFRAERVAQNLSEELDVKGPADRLFDPMMDGGYVVGRHNGLSDARRSSQFDPDRQACPDLPKGPQLCDAYLIGYRWGYSDGYSNQRSESDTQQASR